MKIIPKDWGDFQHYKDRSPSWIKLHKNLLDNYEFQMMHVASKALAPMLWLLASEYEGGVIDASIEKLCFRLRMSPKEFNDALKPLIDNGFFYLEQVASNTLAECYPQKRREEERREEESAVESQPDGFDSFWSAYPKKVAKPAAQKAFKAAKINGHLPEVLADIEAKSQSDSWLANKGQFIPNPATYLNQRRWEDQTGQQSPQVAGAI